MTLSKLTLIPDSSSYSATPGNGVVRSTTSGGPSRTRLDVLGAPAAVHVKWLLGPEGYEYIMAFFRTAVMQGSLPFLVDLLLDSSAVSEYEAKFIPGTLGLVEQSGLLYVVEADLEVMPMEEDADYDDTLVWVYEAYGDDAANFFTELEILVNESFTT